MTTVSVTTTLDAICAGLDVDSDVASKLSGLNLLSAAEALRSNRVLFLKMIAERGVTNLGQRQKIANTLAKAVREGHLASSTPPAPVPPTPEPPDPTPSARGSTGASADVAASEAAGTRVFALSDVHTDRAENMAWCRSLAVGDRFAGDVLLLAGDVASNVQTVRATLALLKRAFARVFFCPGNHDVWLVRSEANASGDSLEKLHELLRLCAECGVETRPAIAAGAIIVPMLSWHHQSWDTEPEVEGWEGIPPAEVAMTDYHVSRWPPHLSMRTDSVAEAVDALNDAPAPLAEVVARLRAARPGAPVISFSHFLPDQRLCPEKRFLTLPSLSKAVGSRPLGERVARLRPEAHVFGHTHFGWDATLDGIRYFQAALAYPEERGHRLQSLKAGGQFPTATPSTPLLVFDSGRGFPPRYNAAWSPARFELAIS